MQIKETGQMIKGSFIISIVSFILLIVCIANIGPGGVRGNVDDVMIIIVLFVFLIASFALGFYNWFKKEKLDKKLK